MRELRAFTMALALGVFSIPSAHADEPTPEPAPLPTSSAAPASLTPGGDPSGRQASPPPPASAATVHVVPVAAVPPPELQPRYDEPPAVPMRRDLPMMASGIVVAILGASAMVGGGGLISDARPEGCNQQLPSCEGDDDKELAGGVLMAMGGVATLIGIPLILLGARQRPAESSAGAQLLVGPGSVAMRGRFH